MLNNNDRQFGYWDDDIGDFRNSLSLIEYRQQYKEYIRGESLIAEKIVCLDPKRYEELSVLIEKKGRKLDKFLIRAMIQDDKDVTNLDISKIKDMSSIFAYLHNFNQNINSWDVSKVTDMRDMFNGATSFNQPLDNWNVSNVSQIVRAFNECTSFKQYLGDWCFIPNINKPWINGIEFDQHNQLHQFTENRLISFIEKYNNSSYEDKDKNKYELMKYIKQYSQHNYDEFINIINELKDKNIKLDISV